MSEEIPSYIGSKLGSIPEELEVRNEVEAEKFPAPKDAANEPSSNNAKLTIPVNTGKRKKPTGAKSKTRKSPGGVKKLPTNPNATAGKVDIPKVVPVQESSAPSETVIANDPSDAEEPKVTPAINMAASLKSMPSKRKSSNSPATKRKKKTAVPSKLNQIGKLTPTENNAVEELKTTTEPTAEVPNPKPIIEEATPETASTKEEVPDIVQPSKTIQKPMASTIVKKAAVAPKKKTYLDQLREETKLFLDQLAEERAQRSRELDEFRKQVRKDLSSH